MAEMLAIPYQQHVSASIGCGCQNRSLIIETELPGEFKVELTP